MYGSLCSTAFCLVHTYTFVPIISVVEYDITAPPPSANLGPPINSKVSQRDSGNIYVDIDTCT